MATTAAMTMTTTAMVNIPTSTSDPQYRYKMPRLIAKFEGRGNGIKTCILNMSEVARALKRPPQYPTKWLGEELGTPAHYSEDGNDGSATVEGLFDPSDLQLILDKFIEKYVCCQGCHLPELDMVVKKGKTLMGKCKVCGWEKMLDNKTRLGQFITKYPPDKTGLKLKSEAGTGKKKHHKHHDKIEGTDQESCLDEEPATPPKETAKLCGNDSDAETDEDLRDDISVASVISCKSKHQKGKPDKKGKEKDYTEKMDRKEKPKHTDRKDKKKDKEKSGKHAKDKKDQTCHKGYDGPLEYDAAQIKETILSLKQLVDDKGVDMPVDEFFMELRLEQLAKVFDHKMRLYVTLEVMCGTAMTLPTLTAKKPHIAKAITNASMPARDILWAFTVYFKANPGETTVKCLPQLLKVLYDEDWTTEEEIVRYFTDGVGGDDPGFNEAKKHAEPFLTWLSTAESQEEEEDDEEASEDVDGEKKANGDPPDVT